MKLKATEQMLFFEALRVNTTITELSLFGQEIETKCQKMKRSMGGRQQDWSGGSKIDK